jgi:hypothetical protein
MSDAPSSYVAAAPAAAERRILDREQLDKAIMNLGLFCSFAFYTGFQSKIAGTMMTKSQFFEQWNLTIQHAYKHRVHGLMESVIDQADKRMAERDSDEMFEIFCSDCPADRRYELIMKNRRRNDPFPYSS